MSTKMIRTRYQQYKSDTVALSSWLARAAIQQGYPMDNFERSSQPLGGDALVRSAAQIRNAKKKKAAKAKSKLQKDPEVSTKDIEAEDDPSFNVRESHNVAQTQPAAAPPGSFLLKTHQYKDIAEFLVSKDITIPVELLRVLRRCISLRLSTSRRFARGSSSDLGHNHFIDILCDVENIFKGAKGEVPDKKLPSSSNRFASLEVDDGSGPVDEEEMPDIHIPAPAQRPDAPSAQQLSFGLEMTAGEAICLLLSFFEDLEKVRNYVKALWLDYKKGDIDLMTAAVTSNTALELLRKSCEDVENRVLTVFGQELGLILGSTLNLLRGTFVSPHMAIYNEVADTDTLTTRLYDFLLIPLMQIINGHVDLVEGDSIPIYKPGYLGYHTPDAPTTKFSKRWEQCTVIAAESLTEFLMVIELGQMRVDSRNTINLFYVDQTVFEIDRFFRNKKCTLALMVAWQVYLDINLTIGSATQRGIKELQEGAARMGKALRERVIVEGGARPKDWIPENEVVIKAFQAEATFFEKSEFIMGAKAMLGRTQRLPGLRDPKMYLMERDPMLCGLMLFRLQVQYQDIGFKLSNTWGSIQYTAHLLEACRHAKGPDTTVPPWPDMDLVLKLHGEEDIFGGKTPTNLDDAYACLQLVAGYSTETITASRHIYTNNRPPDHLLDGRQHPIMAKGGTKALKDHTQLLPIFGKKYLDNVMADVVFDITIIEAAHRTSHRRGTKRPSG